MRLLPAFLAAHGDFYSLNPQLFRHWFLLIEEHLGAPVTFRKALLKRVGPSSAHLFLVPARRGVLVVLWHLGLQLVLQRLDLRQFVLDLLLKRPDLLIDHFLLLLVPMIYLQVFQ